MQRRCSSPASSDEVSAGVPYLSPGVSGLLPVEGPMESRMITSVSTNERKRPQHTTGGNYVCKSGISAAKCGATLIHGAPRYPGPSGPCISPARIDVISRLAPAAYFMHTICDRSHP
jgi:hypothetical protein